MTLTAKPSVHASIAAIWRLEAVKAIAIVARLTRDVGVAEALADLLSRLGPHEEARAPWRRAAQLTHNACERGLLLTRAAVTAR